MSRGNEVGKTTYEKTPMILLIKEQGWSQDLFGPVSTPRVSPG